LEKNFECTQVFEGHSHYVMMIRINPRDTNTFASASLDRTIKVWGLTATKAPQLIHRNPHRTR
jgi:coatomer subunit beta'